MFKVCRPAQAPECSKKTGYNTAQIVEALESIFHGKCYLCEQSDLMDPEIEHFEPHENDENKKFDWLNLFYACGRCNNIKSNRHRDLLNCCDEEPNIFRSIRCIVPSIPDSDILVSSPDNSNDKKTLNTITLLERCYNDQSTSFRRITRESMIEKIFSHYFEFLELRTTIINRASGQTEKGTAIERLRAMLAVNFPFSVFWRWHLIEDRKLYNVMKDHITF